MIKKVILRNVHEKREKLKIDQPSIKVNDKRFLLRKISKNEIIKFRINKKLFKNENDRFLIF